MTVYLKHVNIATKRVARDLDWTHLCDRWEQEDFMSRSEANTNARFKLPFTHRDDTATFLRHKQKKVCHSFLCRALNTFQSYNFGCTMQKEEGKEVNEIVLF